MIKNCFDLAIRALLSGDDNVRHTDNSLYILCSMYGCVSDEYRERIKKIVSDNLDIMTPYTAYRAIIDGVMEYDDDIYNRFFRNTSNTRAYFRDGNEPCDNPQFLVIKLFEYNRIGSLPVGEGEEVYDLVTDPRHFDYDHFDPAWWPLLKFSDIGMVAVKYGKSQILSAIEDLDEEDRKEAMYYINIYSDDGDIDPDDIYYIPEYIENPRI